MGYKSCLELIPNKRLNAIRDLTIAELDTSYGQDGHINLFDDILKCTQLFEFGKANDVGQQIIEVCEPLFTNAEVQESFSDYGLYIANQLGVKKAIELYVNKTEDYYLGLLDDEYEKLDVFKERHPNILFIADKLNYILGKFGLNFNIELRRTVSHKDKCVQAIRDKLNWISPKYRSLAIAEKMGDLIGSSVVTDDSLESMTQEKSALVNLDINKEFTMTDTWLYEYEVFTLLNIYKNIDWYKYSVLFVEK